MRTVYLIRHGLPDFPGGRKMCLGRTDVPLSRLGRMQAVLAGAALEEAGPTAVFTSPLSRAQETAQWLPCPPVVLPGLTEVDVGLWDGLTFDEIRRRFPELYAARGVDPTLPLPGAEPKEVSLARVSAAVREALARSVGDIAIVAHAGVIGLLWGTHEKVPYGSITRFISQNGRLEPVSLGDVPLPPLTELLCLRLLEAAAVPEPVVRHCRAVAAEALRLADLPTAAGLNRSLILAGALLHDVARDEPDHPARGAHYLEALGYPETAQIIRTHHDPEDDRITEAAIVFLADKLIVDDGRVTLEERFARSLRKCRTEEQRRAHAQRRAAAFRVWEAMGHP